MKILFTGGGTAGHLFPIISIIREIKKAYPKKHFDFFYLGPEDSFAKNLFPREGIKVKKILAGKIRRYFSFWNIIDIFFKIPFGILQAFYYIFTISPDVIFSKGGYGSFPVVFSGWLLMTPIFLHESDVSPGLTNKIADIFALKVFVSFPAEKTEYFSKKKMYLTGNPIRKEILEGSLEEAKKMFGLSGAKPIILILGGSQGSQTINDKILLGLNDFLSNFELIHLTGRANFNQVRAEADVVIKNNLKKYYHPLPFLKDKELANAYKAADLIISRAGAGTIFEIAAVSKPSILVPISGSAQEHQIKNAYAYAEKGAALVIEEPNFTPHFLLEKLKFLFSNPKELEKMSVEAEKFARPEAAKTIADYLVAYLQR
jgi:UDP-N-acetylglucosamine--N-acetylmuramyl-(pentapeptide) pyrophosphoryl-undecaprenol N-acetylglucosamine transferase